MIGAATISACGTYRYTLRRHVPSFMRGVKPCLFVMLNPSTADATLDDPTIRRCIGFAKREGCTGLTVVNLFALRATDPSELGKHADPFGPDNGRHVCEQIEEHMRIGVIVAAWGAHPMALRHERASILQKTLQINGALCLGMTKDSSPRHPLYVRGDQPLIPWTPSCRPNTVDQRINAAPTTDSAAPRTNASAPPVGE